MEIKYVKIHGGLLLCADLHRKYGKKTVRFTNLEWTNGFHHLIPVVEKYLLKEQFVPLSLLGAAYFPGEERIWGGGLAIGHSESEVEKVVMQMEKGQPHPKEVIE